MLARCQYCDGALIPIPPTLDDLIWHPLLRFCPSCYQWFNRLVTYNPVTTSRFVEYLPPVLQVEDTQFGPPASNVKTEFEEVSETCCFIHPPGACGICLEEFQLEQLYRKLGCKHRFHDGCISEWLKEKRSCPLCRQRCQ